MCMRTNIEHAGSKHSKKNYLLLKKYHKTISSINLFYCFKKFVNLKVTLDQIE